MNRFPPIILCGGRTRLRQPERPTPGGNRKISGHNVFLFARRLNLPVCQESERQHRQTDQPVYKELADGGNGGRAEKKLQQSE